MARDGEKNTQVFIIILLVCIAYMLFKIPLNPPVNQTGRYVITSGVILDTWTGSVERLEQALEDADKLRERISKELESE